MADDRSADGRRQSDREQFAATVGAKEKRKLRGRAARRRSPWFWAGMFGLVGWSVAVPAVLCLFLGMKLDEWKFGPTRVSWTLTGIVIGAFLGALNAWFWVKRESAREE